jgi:hypothetical protein
VPKDAWLCLFTVPMTAITGDSRAASATSASLLSLNHVSKAVQFIFTSAHGSLRDENASGEERPPKGSLPLRS